MNFNDVWTMEDSFYDDDNYQMREYSLIFTPKPTNNPNVPSLDGKAEDARFEAGLIAQEIWYDCPELRHLVSVGSRGKPAENIPTSDDPTVDPDYSSWGPEPASVDYTGFIPYLIRAFQEQHAELKAKDAKISALEAQLAIVMVHLGLSTSGNVEQ